MQRTNRHEPRRPRSLLRVWLVSCAVAVVVALAGHFFAEWTDCAFLPGQDTCAVRVLDAKLYSYVAGFVILLAMSIYVLIAARRRSRQVPR